LQLYTNHHENSTNHIKSIFTYRACDRINITNIHLVGDAFGIIAMYIERSENMDKLEHEKEIIIAKLIRKGPHILEFSNDCLMVHNGKLTIATPDIMNQYKAARNTKDEEKRNILARSLAELIDKEYYRNRSIEWYSLREYLGHFDVNRLAELKERINCS